MTGRALLCLPAAAWAGRALAAPATGQFAVPADAPARLPAVTGLGQVTFALLLVLVAVFVVAWLVRRARGLGNRAGTALDVLAEVPLGPRERAVLLKVGSTQLLLGVAAGHVNTLHVLTEPIEIQRRASLDVHGFRTVLLRSLGKS
jgi:flagellar protein FliO/FliZ